MTRGETIKADDVFSIAYPFVVDTFMEYDGEGSCEVPTWRPGVRLEEMPPEGHPDCVADAMGRMLLAVVSVHKPGPYPMRVFYIRRWLDPNGKPFGKSKLRISSAAAFRALTKGYRHRIDRVTGTRLPAAREARSSDSDSLMNDGENLK